MARLTVMHVIDSGGLYGAERVLLDLARETAAAGHRVIVSPIIAPQDEADAVGDEAEALGLEVIRFSIPDGLQIRAFRAVLERARSEGVDVIHSHGYKCNILLALQRRSTRPCPIIATLHGWTARQLFSRMGIYEALERSLLSRLDQVVAVSAELGARVPRRVHRNKVNVVPNGVSCVTGPAGAKTDPAIAEFIRNRPAVLAAGRLSWEKGFDVLIRAMALVTERLPDACLVIVGEGAERPALEALIKSSGLEKAVLMPGYVPNIRDMMPLFQVYALSSYTEGLPAVVLEAMGAGLPVVSTTVGALGEVLGHGQYGRQVQSGEFQALADHIHQLLLDETARRKLREAARARFVEKYSAGVMAEQYTKLYESVVSPA